MTKMSNFHARDAAGRAYLDPQRDFERYQRQKNRVADLKLSMLRAMNKLHLPSRINPEDLI